MDQQWNRTYPNAFMEHNHIEITSIRRDRATVALTIQPESRNPYGYVHGGALYAMADNAAGLAAHSDGRSYVTRSGSLHFLSNRTAGTLRAEAEIRSRGRRMCLAEVSVFGEDGELLATGFFECFCVDQAVRPFRV